MNELGWSLDVLVVAQGSDWCGTALRQIHMEKIHHSDLHTVTTHIAVPEAWEPYK